MESSSIEDAGSESADKLLPLKTLQRLASFAGVVLDPPDKAPIEAESTRKLHSSRYKGVVPQPNGRWGAQIYEKHHRVWLGTFNDEAEAARSYDVAAQRFRGRDAITNFTPLSETSDDVADLIFLNSHSKAEIVDMLRKHTYYDELMHSKDNKNVTAGGVVASSSSNSNISERLFHKAVTPSDVGKLNRLVIPKQQAEKHFPLEQMSKGMLLCFEDGSGKVWRFRYSYWNSSQSYVLTKGWSRFVKEKSLKAGDVVSFQRRGAAEKEQLFIDVLPLQPVARAVDVFRLFGVNICKLPIGKGRDEEEDGAGDFVVGWSEKRGRTIDMVSSPTQMLKQRCTRAL